MSEELKATCSGINRETVLRELEDKGYVVVPGILTEEECNTCIAEYKEWLGKFPEHGLQLQQRKSVIQSYRVGHFPASWRIRLKSKNIFASVWKTDKLLSSIDGIAIADPKTTDYREDGKDWLHLDQGAQRVGLHAYQGAVYLEGQTEEDYCFRVLENSHKLHTQLFEEFPRAVTKTAKLEFYKLNKAEKNWYSSQGAKLRNVPVPKGGIVLWDSRTVHDNIAPVRKRDQPDRWRFVVFVSMTPAQWASEEDLAFKKEAYRKMYVTSHWSSQRQKRFKPYNPNARKEGVSEVSILQLPDEAQSTEARMLAGVEPYDFHDNTPNGPDKPTWNLNI